MPKRNSGRPATAADARVVMQLYDLRREAEMRKARHFFASEFNPQSLDDVLKIGMAFGTQQNAWFRQLLTYWENAATLVLRGAVHPGLFMDWNHEIVFTYVKLKPFLAAIRKHFESPEFMANTEKLLNSTAENRKAVQDMERRMAKWSAEREKAARAAQAKAS